MPEDDDRLPPITAADQLEAKLLQYYQRELRDAGAEDARAALSAIGITDAATVEHFKLGYCSGRALQAMTEQQYRYLCKVGLAKKRRERLQDCIIIPVQDEHGQLVDLCGLRPWKSGLRYVNWQPVHRGMIGIDAVLQIGHHQGSVILCDNPFHVLHARQHGYVNVAAIRSVDELRGHLTLFEHHGIQRIYMVSRQQRDAITAVLTKIPSLQVVLVKTPPNQIVIPKASYEEAIAGEPPAPVSSANSADESVHLVQQTDARVCFAVSDVRYQVDSAAAVGLSMRVQVRIERDGIHFIDKADLASASSRRKLARHGASRLGLSSTEVEDHLVQIADAIDKLILEAAEQHTQNRAPRNLTDGERDKAMQVLKHQDVLSYLVDCLERGSGFVGEDANKRLAVLIAASRLLPQPLGAMIRGPAGCGKSALMQAVCSILPASEVLYFSRLTAQALYFLPKDELQHKLLVCDEYEGLEDSEYALRTVMSSQTLSLAITLREGGKVPVTRTIDVPATLAVMVSTTGTVNIENLSRFIEIGMNASTEQTQRVMKAMASRRARPGGDGLTYAQNVNQLLRPCSVTIPYADRLTYSPHSVLARRKFAQIVGLIAAHAVLHQHQRAVQVDAAHQKTIEATPADYEAVYPLLAHIIEHFEEDVSPSAMRLLDAVQAEGLKRLTRQQVMDMLNWSYSQAYRVLQELVNLDLLIPDTTTNGVLRTYEVAPFHQSERGITQITPPEAIPPEGGTDTCR